TYPHKKTLSFLKGFHNIFVVPLGLEPRLFCTKNRRVASYTMGQFHNVPAKRKFLFAGAKLETKSNLQSNKITFLKNYFPNSAILTVFDIFYLFKSPSQG